MAAKTEADRTDIIAKLLAKAEGASTEAEASAFFAKAEELMTKWAIDDLAVRAARTGAPAEEVTRLAFKWEGSSLSTTWDADMGLMHRLATVHGCRMYITRSFRTMTLVGFPSDMNHVVALFQSLMVQVVRFQRQAWSALDQGDKDDMGQYDRRVWARSFREGFTARIGQRLTEARRDVVDEAKATHGSGMELVLVDRKAQVDAYYDNIPLGRARNRGGRTDGQAWGAGASAASRADMGQRSMSSRKGLGR